jgi:O-6-methylguanine DNA methyltransferase
MRAGMKAKKDKVYSLLKKIPEGRVTTYGLLAKAAGFHPRTVGMLMKKNKDSTNTPCYKVVRSDGSIGGYSVTGGAKKKIALLRKDGITIKNGKIDLKKHLFRPSKS